MWRNEFCAIAHKGERTNKRCFSFITIEMRTKQRISDFSVIKIWQTSISLFIYYITDFGYARSLRDGFFSIFTSLVSGFVNPWVRSSWKSPMLCATMLPQIRSQPLPRIKDLQGTKMYQDVPRCTKSISTVYISLAWINLNQLESTWWFWDIPRMKMLSGIVAVDSDLQSLTTDGLHTLGRTWRWKFKPWMNRLAGWEVLEVKEWNLVIYST